MDSAFAPSTSYSHPVCDDLCKEIARRSKGVCILSFSGGKDSVASWIYLRNFFTRIIPVHFSSYPLLKYEQRVLDYYEDAFGTHIVRMVGEELSRCLARGAYQVPSDMEDILDLDVPEWGKLDGYEFIRKTYGLPKAWTAVGIGVGDSIDRRIYCKKVGGKNEGNLTFYPLWAAERKDVLSIIRNSGVKLADSYRYACRSLSGVPSYTCNKIFREHYPEDYEKVLAMYPLAEAKDYREMMLDAEWKRRKDEGIVEDDDGQADEDGGDVGSDVIPGIMDEGGETEE